jgi:pimeloyl-ACP methyl ester carboxylesterase
MTSPLLFLSGAGLPAWIWDDVRAALPTSTVAVYPSAGSLQDYVTKALDEAPERFTLVAHSIGGVVASQLIAQAPERVDGVLAIAASIPQPGQSFLSALPFPQKLIVRAVIQLAGTKPPEKAIRAGLAAGLDESLVNRIVREFTPESAALYRDTVAQRTFPVRRGYLTTTADKEFPAALQQRYAKNLDATWTQSLATGHLPMLSTPGDLSLAIKTFLES